MAPAATGSWDLDPLIRQPLMHHSCSALLALPMVLLALAVAPPCGSAQDVVAVRAARIVDGTGRDPIEDGVVVIEGDRIVSVGPGSTAPSGATVIDLGDATLLPGLRSIGD